MTVGERIKTLSQDWFLTEPLLFAVLCTHAIKRNDNMGCDMRCGKGIIEYNPERLEHFDDNQLALRLKAEVARIILKHPYQRQPYNPRRDVMRLSSDLTLCDNLEGMDTIGLEPPRIFDIPRDQAFEQYYSLMAGEIVQIFSKSFKFISRQNDSNPINPINLLNHREAVCLYKNKFLRND